MIQKTVIFHEKSKLIQKNGLEYCERIKQMQYTLPFTITVRKLIVRGTVQRLVVRMRIRATTPSLSES